MNVPEIDVQKTKTLVAEKSATIVDIRDSRSYAAGHIPGAIRVDDGNVRSFLEETPKDRKIIVCCYHGHSSLSAAAFFMAQGFTDVASMSGGFAAWDGTRE